MFQVPILPYKELNLYLVTVFAKNFSTTPRPHYSRFFLKQGREKILARVRIIAVLLEGLNAASAGVKRQFQM